MTPSLTAFHPEIEHPADEVPGPSCADLAATTAPQIVFTNFFAAAAMGSAFYQLLQATLPASESCFDILEGLWVPQDLGVH